METKKGNTKTTVLLKGDYLDFHVSLGECILSEGAGSIITLLETNMETQKGPIKTTVLLKGDYLDFHVSLRECILSEGAGSIIRGKRTLNPKPPWSRHLLSSNVP